MAKRFIDTKLWNKAWFRKLDGKYKLFYIYLLTNCDHAGIWDADWEATEFYLKQAISYDELPEQITEKMQLIQGKDQYFIPSFIKFQYGELRENSKPHLSVIKRLTEKKLYKGYQRVTNTLKDKEQDKVKDKVQTKEERENDFIVLCKAFYKAQDISDVMLVDFINYWTESNTTGKKMRFEMEKVFDISRRLSKWKINSKKFAREKVETKTFESKFDKYKTGLYKAYCSRCGSREMPADKWQLKEGSNCCRVEYVPTLLAAQAQKLKNV